MKPERKQLLPILAGAAGGGCYWHHGGIFGLHSISVGCNPICHINCLSLGFARSRPCATAGANWRPYGFHSSWSAGRQDMRAGRMGCRIGRRPGNDCDAPDRYVSSARGHRPAGGGIKQYVVVIPIRAGWHRCGVADAFRICLAQSRRTRSQQERRLARQMVVAIARRVRIWLPHETDMPRA